MADKESLNRRKVLKTLGLTGAASTGVFSERASAQNASGNETVGYGEEGETGSISVLGKTERVDLTDNPDLGERIWPVNTDASGGVCRPAAGGTKPATGEGAATWFGFGGCGTWKVFDVQPGETYRITSRIDTCFDCVLFDDAYAVQEFVDGSWETQESYPAIKATKTNARVVEYTPDSDRIRIKNLDGNRGIGFYLRVYGPDEDTERRIAEKFAPTFSFDADEKFFPTDPTRFRTREVDGQTELYGPDALEDYVDKGKDFTVFYNITDPLNDEEIEGKNIRAVSYWQYYAFDQYANVHWHDWEVLHVFFVGNLQNPQDAEAFAVVGSAHTFFAINNQFIDIDTSDIGVLSELGSHANATDINANNPPFDSQNEFDRAFDTIAGSKVEGPSLAPDLVVDPVDVTNYNDAYGLPRDESFGEPSAENAVNLAYYIPEINDTPIDEIYDVSEEDLISSDVDSTRSTGSILSPSDYKLESINKVKSKIDEFTGPQFDITEVYSTSPSGGTIPLNLPAKSFRTVGEPWEEDSFNDPTEILEFDVGEVTNIDTAVDSIVDAVEDRIKSATEEEVRNLRDKLEGAANKIKSKVSGSINDFTSGPDGRLAPPGQLPGGKYTDPGEPIDSDEVIEGLRENANITIRESPKEEGIVLVNSEPRVVPTSNGMLVTKGLEPGKHDLIIGSPNRDAYGQVIQVEEGENRVGIDGNIFLTLSEESVRVSGQLSDSREITNLKISEDFLGQIYDAEPISPQRFELPVHEDGAYTVEIEADDGKTGAYRITPEDETEIRIGEIETGKSVLSQYLVYFLRDTADDARDLIGDENENTNNGGQNESVRGSGGIANSIASKFEAAADAAERAVETIENGRGNVETKANNQLNTVRNQLNAIENELDNQRGKKIGEAAYLILVDRLEQGREKVDEAIDAEVD